MHYSSQLFDLAVKPLLYFIAVVFEHYASLGQLAYLFLQFGTSDSLFSQLVHQLFHLLLNKLFFLSQTEQFNIPSALLFNMFLLLILTISHQFSYFCLILLYLVDRLVIHLLVLVPLLLHLNHSHLVLVVLHWIF